MSGAIYLKVDDNSSELYFENVIIQCTLTMGFVLSNTFLTGM